MIRIAAVLFLALFLGSSGVDASGLRSRADRTRRQVAKSFHGGYYGFGSYAHYNYKRAQPRSLLYPNGVTGPVFDTQYPDLGCIPRARAYIYDRAYDRDAPYCRGWKNSQFGISLDGKHK